MLLSAFTDRSGRVVSVDCQNKLAAILEGLLENDATAPLAPFVSEALGSGRRGTHYAVELIRTLALDAPVCHLVKPSVWGLTMVRPLTVDVVCT